jgi:hypothetical protein
MGTHDPFFGPVVAAVVPWAAEPLDAVAAFMPQLTGDAQLFPSDAINGQTDLVLSSLETDLDTIYPAAGSLHPAAGVRGRALPQIAEVPRESDFDIEDPWGTNILFV